VSGSLCKLLRLRQLNGLVEFTWLCERRWSLTFFSFFQVNRQVAIPNVDLPGIFAPDRLLDQHQ
jgi:hypothetical protein